MGSSTHRAEEAGLAAANKLNLPDAASEPAFDDIVEIAAVTCGGPISLLLLRDHERWWFKSRRGLDASELPQASAFCIHTLEQGGLLIVSEPLADRRFAENPLVTRSPYIRFYAGVSVASPASPEGPPIGTLCVMDVHESPSFEDAL